MTSWPLNLSHPVWRRAASFCIWNRKWLCLLYSWYHTYEPRRLLSIVSSSSSIKPRRLLSHSINKQRARRDNRGRGRQRRPTINVTHGTRPQPEGRQGTAGGRALSLFSELAERKEKARRPESGCTGAGKTWVRVAGMHSRESRLLRPPLRFCRLPVRAIIIAPSVPLCEKRWRSASGVTRGTALLPRQGKRQHPPFVHKRRTLRLRFEGETLECAAQSVAFSAFVCLQRVLFLDMSLVNGFLQNPVLGKTERTFWMWYLSFCVSSFGQVWKCVKTRNSNFELKGEICGRVSAETSLAE